LTLLGDYFGRLPNSTFNVIPEQVDLIYKMITMKRINLLLALTVLITASSGAYSQQGNKKNAYDKVNNIVAKGSNIIAVFSHIY
jgi:hypothetical protein